MRVETILRAGPLLALAAFCQMAIAQTPVSEPPASTPTSNTFVTERRPDQWLASGLKAKNVYDRSDAKIGVINDLVIDRDGRVAAVVVGVGGFLGIGEKNVGVAFQDIKISMRENNEWLILDRTRDDLRAAPAFGASSAPSHNVSGANDRNYGTLNAPNRSEEGASR